MHYNKNIMFSKSPWKKGLNKSKTEAFGWINEFFIKPEITESTWEELEERLIKADVGLSVSSLIVNNIHQLSRKNGIKKTSDLKLILREELLQLVHKPEFSGTIPKPMIVMLVGVNGSGKTTTIAKLAKYYKTSQKSVMLIGADTYRAAAVEQLTSWAKALDVPIISGQAGSDPGAVVFDGINHAIARNIESVLIDTAGRLHTKYNLMEELRKIHRVAGKSLSGAPHEVWLILDATTGQNALAQARVLKKQ